MATLHKYLFCYYSHDESYDSHDERTRKNIQVMISYCFDDKLLWVEIQVILIVLGVICSKAR